MRPYQEKRFVFIKAESTEGVNDMPSPTVLAVEWPKIKTRRTKMLNQVKRWWKQIVAVMLLAALIIMPSKFLVYNLDIAFKLVMAVGGLLLARLAKSAYDSWQSKPTENKGVSVSRYMRYTDDELGKGIVHAAQIITIAIIIAAAISAG